MCCYTKPVRFEHAAKSNQSLIGVNACQRLLALALFH